MDLHVLRHGLAGVRDSGEYPNDAERPLTLKGARRMARQVRGMNSIGLSVDVILTSPLTRAFETAEIVHKGLKKAGPLVFCDALAPTGAPSRLLDRIATEYTSASDVMIVGHEPYLSSLIAVLVSGDLEPVSRLKKGALCKVHIPALEYGQCGWIEWSLTPKQMVKLG